MMDHGRNPMRWNCETKGCFNKKRRPKIEEFAECLPGRIAFSDVDAIVEVNDHFLWLEWKSYEGPLPTGQRIMFERMTHGEEGRFSVLVIVGNAETMQVEASAWVLHGKVGARQPSDLEDVKERIRRWAQWALRRGRVAS